MGNKDIIQQELCGELMGDTQSGSPDELEAATGCTWRRAAAANRAAWLTMASALTATDARPPRSCSSAATRQSEDGVDDLQGQMIALICHSLAVHAPEHVLPVKDSRWMHACMLLGPRFKP